jgi:hypothetical protein
MSTSACALAVAEELPRVAHLADEVEVQVAHDDVLVLGAAALADEVALGIDELARPVEGDRLLAVLVVLAPDAVRGADEVAVRRGRGRLLEVPEPVGEPGLRGVRVEDDLGAVQRERYVPRTDPSASTTTAVL